MCRLKYVSGTDYSSTNNCFSGFDPKTGKTNIDTSDANCMATGPGNFDMCCNFTTDPGKEICSTDWPGTSPCVTMEVVDWCDARVNTLTSLAPPALVYEEFRITGSMSTNPTISSDFITIADTTNCAFTQCKLKNSNGATCGTDVGLANYFTGKMDPTDPLKVVLDTNTMNV